MATIVTGFQFWTSIKIIGKRRFIRLLHNTSNVRAAVSSNKEEKDENQKTTHFGFETVTEQEKEERVYSVFKNVADKYDLMNDAMSVGIHRLWKDYFMKKLAPCPGTQLIDVAGGTGDIAFRFLNYVNSLPKEQVSSDDNNMQHPIDSTSQHRNTERSSLHSDMTDNTIDMELLGNRTCDSHVTVCDINQSMLEVGQHRAHEAGIYSGMAWLKGNAECLPVADSQFDAYTIAFGIRNCTHVEKVVQEAYRVLKPGGRFMCLEFSHVENPLLRSVYDQYSFQVIPVLGQILAADWNSYQYLVESIRQFPKQREFKSMIQCSGFKAVTYENLTFGVVAIHSGFKL